MAKKSNRISINALESTIDKNTNEFDINFHDITVHITKTLSLQEMLEFVSSVVESCFMEDGEYLPEAFELAFRCNVLTRYANFTLPESTEKKYALAYASDAYCTVREYINHVQFDDIYTAAVDKIEHRKNMIICEQRRRVDELTSACSALIEKVGGMFADVNAEDIVNVVKAMGNSEIDEEAIVRAYLQEQKSSGDE